MQFLFVGLCHVLRLWSEFILIWNIIQLSFVVVLLFYVHGKHLRSCRDGQLT